MPRIPFADLPDHGRLWVFPISRALEGAEVTRCEEVVDAFLDQWAAHGHPLRAGRELRERRFLLVGVDVDAEAPSGCSIDALTNALRRLGVELGVSFIDHAPVWFRQGEEVLTVSRPEFRQRATSGEVTSSTRVFDTSLTRVSDLRSGKLEQPAAQTWHGKAFFREQVGA
jgi:hypothetical protein